MTSYLVSCPDCGHRFPVERDTMRAVDPRPIAERIAELRELRDRGDGSFSRRLGRGMFGSDYPEDAA